MPRIPILQPVLYLLLSRSARAGVRRRGGACRKSALHGLGHWAAAYPAQVEAIISTWVRAQSGLRPDLQRYADAARHGCVL